MFQLVPFFGSAHCVCAHLAVTGASDRQLLVMRGATVQVLSRSRTHLSCVLPVPLTCSIHLHCSLHLDCIAARSVPTAMLS